MLSSRPTVEIRQTGQTDQQYGVLQISCCWTNNCVVKILLVPHRYCYLTSATVSWQIGLYCLKYQFLDTSHVNTIIYWYCIKYYFYLYTILSVETRPCSTDTNSVLNLTWPIRSVPQPLINASLFGASAVFALIKPAALQGITHFNSVFWNNKLFDEPHPDDIIAWMESGYIYIIVISNMYIYHFCLGDQVMRSVCLFAV